MKKRLITSALPYVNNIPHLGNLIQVLSADVFARFCRSMGYETLYVCGTDEYGTATETKAREEGVSPRELCDRFHVIHRDIYAWFNIAFDHFGRTSSPEQTEIVQGIFNLVREHGYIKEHTIEQLYSESADMFLADRFVRGTCPSCAYEDARGDQCENCGKLLDPSDLINPRSAIDGSIPVLKSTSHLYIDLPALKDKLELWMKEASERGFWARNAIQMTQSWIRDGLKERAITRDLKWGIPVPVPGYEKKVFYVWFDAPIGYISITAQHTPQWKDWWQNPKEVELFQFIGKDNIPFHTVIFPSSLLATGEPWTMLHHMSSTEYLNYESGKFSKSKGVGVFGNDCQDTGIPSDVWRFYIFYNRPETSDYVFTWKDFAEKVNKELIGNVGNLVNRTLTFWHKNWGTVQPELTLSDPLVAPFWAKVVEYEDQIAKHYDRADLRDGLRSTLDLAAWGNKYFQDHEPWKLMTTDPVRAKTILSNLLYLVRDLAITLEPIIPEGAQKLMNFFGHDKGFLTWKNLAKPGPLTQGAVLQEPRILFAKLEADHIEILRERYSGSQAERKARDAEPPAPKTPAPKPRTASDDPVGYFNSTMDLRVATITSIERHPSAEKLYIERLDDGSPEGRTIVSGLVPYYKPEDLLGKNIIVVANLKPAKLRGVESAGMLLAASNKSEGDVVEVVFAPQGKPGDQVHLKGHVPSGPKAEMDINAFFALPLVVINGRAQVGGLELCVRDQALETTKVLTGALG